METLNSLLTELAHWQASIPWEPYAVAAGISLILAVSEIVSVFEADPVRALGTGGSFLLLFLNAIFVVLLLAIVRKLRPDQDYFWTAIAVGFGLPTLLRTRFTLVKPLPGSTGEGVEISLDQVYGRLQGFCKRRIDLALASKRIQLVERAMHELDLEALAKRLRLLLEGGLQTATADSAGYVDKVVYHPTYDEERKRMLLAFTILNRGGHRMLQEMIKANKGKRRRFRPKRSKIQTPTATPPQNP